MAVTTPIGKVTITPKGTWSSSSTYERLDLVEASGTTYVAKQNVPANTAITNTTYWQMVVTAGIGQSGGIVNGDLIVQDNHLVGKATNLDESTAPLTAISKSALNYVDTNDNIIMSVRVNQNTSNYIGTGFRMQRNFDAQGNPTYSEDVFMCYMDASGNVSYAVSNKDKFREAIGSDIFTIDASISAGTTVTITDSRINPVCHVDKGASYFGTPRYVNGPVTWSVDGTNHTVTLSGTFTGATTVHLVMTYIG